MIELAKEEIYLPDRCGAGDTVPRLGRTGFKRGNSDAFGFNSLKYMHTVIEL